MRAAFGKNGGNMGVSGAVSYMFDNTGIIGFAGDDADEILEYLMEKTLMFAMLLKKTVKLSFTQNQKISTMHKKR